MGRGQTLLLHPGQQEGESGLVTAEKGVEKDLEKIWFRLV